MLYQGNNFNEISRVINETNRSLFRAVEKEARPIYASMNEIESNLEITRRAAQYAPKAIRMGVKAAIADVRTRVKEFLNTTEDKIQRQTKLSDKAFEGLHTTSAHIEEEIKRANKNLAKGSNRVTTDFEKLGANSRVELGRIEQSLEQTKDKFALLE